MIFKFNKLGMVLCLICMGNQFSYSQTPVQVADFAKAAKFDVLFDDEEESEGSPF